MTTDLFPAATSASPRLRWLAKHGLMTRHYDGPHGCGGPEGPGWICGNVARTRNAGGESEREAEMAYAARYGIKHWAMEDWERAIGAVLEDLDT